MEFYKGKGGPKPQKAVQLDSTILNEAHLFAQTDPTQYKLVGDDYETSKAGLRVVRAVNTALTLRLPLLVSGEPGCGKTQLGYSIAHELGLPKPIKFVTKSTSQSSDLFYEYDAVRHFQDKSGSSPRDYIQYTGLGLAILLAMDRFEREAFLPDLHRFKMLESYKSFELRERLEAKEPTRSVVIIDEIDKAPRDFPNDLLHEVENMSFRVPELKGIETPDIDPAYKPIVIITTNSERQLPDAFLRRCAYVHMDYPKGSTLEAILSARLENLFAAGAPFVRDVQKFYEYLREQKGIHKQPGISELLQFMQVMAAAEIDQTKMIKDQVEEVEKGLSLLSKIREDVDRTKSILEDYIGKAQDN